MAFQDVTHDFLLGWLKGAKLVKKPGRAIKYVMVKYRALEVLEQWQAKCGWGRILRSDNVEKSKTNQLLFEDL